MTRVIVSLQPGAQFPAEFERLTRRLTRLGIVNGQVVDVPNWLLKQLAAHPSVFNIHYDRPVARFNYRTSLTVGTRAVRDLLGVTGAGVTVAVIDSGIAAWHDDLTSRSSTLYPYGNQRVAGFVDFVNGQLLPYDDNGHGTHVAGIIAGNGYDVNGARAGAAPDASIVSLKVLDANGGGSISSVIAALDWVLANHTAYKIRVVNLSVGAAITESYWTDPLALAAKRLVDDGVVVVAAAGNFGKNSQGLPQYGGISAPGNAPWVLTVGASSTGGTPERGDDTIANFSSRGPTYVDWTAKPDLVAPGTGIVSMLAPGSTLEATKTQFSLPGTVATASLPYLSLSGTSMAAPVVAGTVALMLQANPALTPNAVKAILEYTAQQYPGYNALTQGAGFLNAVGAVRLAKFYATARPGDVIPVQSVWGKSIIWGNHKLKGGVPLPAGNAWSLGTTWGAAKVAAGQNIVWGTQCADACNNIVWGTSVAENIVWGTSFEQNIVWGTAVDQNIVWGTAANDENIVWGTDCGGADCDNTIWGTVDVNNIVWGTASVLDNIVWGTSMKLDNIVWGTADALDIVWSTNDATDNIVWGTASGLNGIAPGAEAGAPALVGAFDSLSDTQIFDLSLAPPPPALTPPDTPLIIDSTPIVVAPETTVMPTAGTVVALAVELVTVPVTTDPAPAVVSEPQSTTSSSTTPTTDPAASTNPITIPGGSL